MTNGELWDRLEAFEIGNSGAQLTFQRRLARENGWSLPFAERVVQEYKRFLFLCVEAGHKVTPSVAVDQAWHLHLTYTESYWKDLCRDVLHREIHHGPTQGGDAEDAKYFDWYAKTLESYARIFGEAAPTDVWPAPEQRFAERPRWVDLNRYILIPKPPKVVFASVAILLLSLVVGGCAADLEGPGIWFIFIALCFLGLISMLFKGGGGRGGGGSNNSGGGWWGGGCGGGGCSSSGGGGGGCGGGGCGGG